MNWYKIYIHWNNIRRYYCIAWEKWFPTFVYTSQKLIHLLRWECFPLCTKGDSPVYREITSLLPWDFYQLLYTNQYFLNTNLVLSHIHTLTNTSLKIPFHLWAIVSQTRGLAISIIWNIWMSNKNSSQKSKAKLKTVNKFVLKHVPLTSMSMLL